MSLDKKLKEMITFMVNKAKIVKNYKLHSLDGEIGKSMNLLRWLLLSDSLSYRRHRKLAHWHAGVDIPACASLCEKEDQNVAINLTKKQIEGSSSLDKDKPVSLQFEEEYYGYFKWSTYWEESFMGGFQPNIEFEQIAQKESTSDENVGYPFA